MTLLLVGLSFIALVFIVGVLFALKNGNKITNTANAIKSDATKVANDVTGKSS